MTMEPIIKDVELTAIRIADRPDWDTSTDAVHWLVTLKRNGAAVSIEHSEGIGHFIQQGVYSRRKIVQDAIYQAVLKLVEEARVDLGGHITQDDIKWTYDSTARPERVKRVKRGYMTYEITVTPPKVDDVIYCMQSDSHAVDCDFEDWCDNYGYDTDSIKAKETFEACRDQFFKLRKLGFDLDELAELFQDY